MKTVSERWQAQLDTDEDNTSVFPLVEDGYLFGFLIEVCTEMGDETIVTTELHSSFVKHTRGGQIIGTEFFDPEEKKKLDRMAKEFMRQNEVPRFWRDDCTRSDE